MNDRLRTWILCHACHSLLQIPQDLPTVLCQNFPNFTQSTGQVLHVTCHLLTLCLALLLATSVSLLWPYAVPGALQACVGAFSYTLPSAGNASTQHTGLLHVCSAFMGLYGPRRVGRGWRMGLGCSDAKQTSCHFEAMVRDPELCCVRVTCWEESPSVAVNPSQSRLHF